MSRVDLEVSELPLRRRRLTTLHELLQDSDSDADRYTDSDDSMSDFENYPSPGDFENLRYSSDSESEPPEPAEDRSSVSLQSLSENESDESSVSSESTHSSTPEDDGPVDIARGNPNLPYIHPLDYMALSPTSMARWSVVASTPAAAPAVEAARAVAYEYIAAREASRRRIEEQLQLSRQPAPATSALPISPVAGPSTISGDLGRGESSGSTSQSLGNTMVSIETVPMVVDAAAASTSGDSLRGEASGSTSQSLGNRGVSIETVPMVVDAAAASTSGDSLRGETSGNTSQSLAIGTGSVTMETGTTSAGSTVAVAMEAVASTSASDLQSDQDSSFGDFKGKSKRVAGQKFKMATGGEAAWRNESTDDEAECCPICFEPWTNSGLHRLTSLKCGHLFGMSCIEKWLKTSGSLRCPQCKSRARRKDIRILFAKSIRCMDTLERERAVQQVDKERDARRKAEVEAARSRLQHRLAVAECQRLREEVERQRQMWVTRSKECKCDEWSAGEVMTRHILGNASSSSSRNASSSTSSLSSAEAAKFHFHRDIKISETGGCRVLAYCQKVGTLCVSQPSTNALFQGFGVKKLNVLDFRMSEYVSLHSKAIRDLTFGGDGTLLSCSVDRTLRLTNLHSNRPMLTYTCTVPIWSCAWNTDDRNYVYAGLQNGTIVVFDTRQLTFPVHELNGEGSGSRSPVVSLQYVPQSMDAGARCAGLLMTQIDRSIFYEKKSLSSTSYAGHDLSMQGNMTSLYLDETSNHVLTTYRPTARHPYVRHEVSQLTMLSELAPDSTLRVRPVCNNLQMFEGGSTLKLLSRSRLLPLPQGQGRNATNQLLACAGDESTRAIHVWSVGRGELLQKLTTVDPVLDLCPVTVNDRTMLAALTEKQLSVYVWR